MIPLQLQPIPEYLNNDLTLLRDNLQNIYPTFFDTENEKLDLVPSLWGDRVYDSQVGWHGRILRVIHRIIEVFVGTDFKEQRLNEVIKKTQDIYLKLQLELHPYLQAYESYLEEKFHKANSDHEKTIHVSRIEIRRFYEATHPFSKLMKRSQTPQSKILTHEKLCRKLAVKEKVERFIKEYFPTQIGQKRIDTPFYSPEVSLKVKRYRDIMALEGITSNGLPLDILKKASIWPLNPKSDSGESDPDYQRLRRWVIKLNKLKNRLDIHAFIKGLSSIVNHLNESMRGHLKADLHQLNKGLCDAGFENFDFKDQKHLKWRSSLKEGDKIPFNFVLGKQLSGKPSGFDHYLVFELEDEQHHVNPDLVLVVGPHRGSLALRELVREEMGWGIPTAKVLYQEPKGYFALTEKLSKPLRSIEWESQTGNSLTKNDQIHAEPIRQYIQWFIDQNSTPSNFSKENLMFDHQGKLKTIKACTRGALEVIDLEKFAYDATGKNHLTVYQYLIHPILYDSGNLKYLNFFKVMIQFGLNGEKRIALREGAKREIANRQVIERASELYHQVIKLKKECEELIAKKYRVVDSEFFQRLLNDEILTFYEKTKTFGRLWKTLTVEKLYQIMLKRASSILEEN